MKNKMANKKSVPKHHFYKSMGADYYVRKMYLNLTGPCAPATVEQSTPSVSTSSRDAGFGWLALAAALAFLLLLIALVLCCCLSRKPRKEKPSEFVSKGLPVVFPEEVGGLLKLKMLILSFRFEK